MKLGRPRNTLTRQGTKILARVENLVISIRILVPYEKT